MKVIPFEDIYISEKTRMLFSSFAWYERTREICSGTFKALKYLTYEQQEDKRYIPMDVLYRSYNTDKDVVCTNFIRNDEKDDVIYLVWEFSNVHFSKDDKPYITPVPEEFIYNNEIKVGKVFRWKLFDEWKQNYFDINFGGLKK